MLFTHTVFDSISYAFPFVYRFLMWYANCVHSSTLFVFSKQKERTAIRRSFFKSVWCFNYCNQFFLLCISGSCINASHMLLPFFVSSFFSADFYACGYAASEYGHIHPCNHSTICDDDYGGNICSEYFWHNYRCESQQS